jgi:deoxyadenosine/deoxycytidine kinase
VSEKRYVVVEGPIGVGKTTLCRLLAKRWKARLVLEEFEDNPFLPRFYSDRSKYAFQTQLFFTVSRFRQQQSMDQLDLFHRRVVADYMFGKDRIFAGVNLSDDELDLYSRLADLLSERLPQPDLVIYLQASLETLLKRIDARGRPYERNMSRRYLESLREAYSDYFFRHRRHPVLVVNTDDVDFEASGEALDALLEAVERHSGGVETYVPRL